MTATNQTTARYTIKRNRRETPANKKELLATYRKVAKHLHQAKQALETISSDWHNWSSADAGYYAEQIGELLSCDHGESGMETLIAMLEKL
jgi:hypothetical protein